MAAQRASDASPYARGQPMARVGRAFIASYAAAYLATSLVFIAPLLVTLALKINSLVGADQAASSLSLVAAAGSLVGLVANPLFGRLSDRTTSRWGMRRPWILGGLTGGSVGILVVALAPGGLAGADRLVPGAVVLQRDAGRDGRGAA
jgi:MFS family permease